MYCAFPLRCWIVILYRDNSSIHHVGLLLFGSSPGPYLMCLRRHFFLKYPCILQYLGKEKNIFGKTVFFFKVHAVSHGTILFLNEYGADAHSDLM